jgi:hypothetical protein
MVGNIEDLYEIWSKVDVCFEHNEKYIAEALQPIVNFRRYRAFDNVAIRVFYPLPRATITGGESVGLLKMLVNLTTLIERMLVAD